MIHVNCLLRVSGAALAALLLVSCSGGGGGPKPAQPGTPGFAWSTGMQAYKAGNYAKAADQFTTLAKGKSEFAERARPMAAVTTLALANSYFELSEKLADGAKKARKGEAAFRRFTGEYKAKAQASAMLFVELSGAYIKAAKAADFKMELPLGPEAPAEPAQYAKFKGGIMVPDAEIPGVEKQVVERELQTILVKQLKVAAGEASDVKGTDMMLALGKGLRGIGEMFAEKKLNQPARIQLAICEQTLEALALVKDNKEAAALVKKTEEAKKKLPKA